jgi:hypothetical protein
MKSKSVLLLVCLIAAGLLMIGSEPSAALAACQNETCSGDDIRLMCICYAAGGAPGCDNTICAPGGPGRVVRPGNFCRDCPDYNLQQEANKRCEKHCKDNGFPIFNVYLLY